MTLRVVIDTNIWIRILLKVTLPILEAFNANKFQLIISQELWDEFHDVLPPKEVLQAKLKQAIAATRQRLPASEDD